MACTSTLSLYSQSQVRLRNQRLQSLALTSAGFAQFLSFPTLNCRRTHSPRVRFGSVVMEGTHPRATGSRRVYRQSQASAPLSSAPLKQIANVVGPFAVLVAVTFVSDSDITSSYILANNPLLQVMVLAAQVYCLIMIITGFPQPGGVPEEF
ncbi:hypothetical protein V8G54_030598 [Vigna mungo]|uniref:Uncharacterized protein n=1 Tax=Vigna mungo TaxID=3915 RepID=A0AAQ3MVY1_VIGMU